MSAACAELRPLLGEYLVGALADAAAARVEAHLTACAACGEELADLGDLAERLGSLGAPTLQEGAPVVEATRRATSARSGGRAAAVLAALGAAAAAGLLVALLLPRGEGGPQVLFGRLEGRAVVERGAPPPRDVALVAAEETGLTLAPGTVVELAPGSRLRLTGPRRIALERGLAALRVEPAAPGAPALEVHTALGSARVLGTRFTVEVKEDEVKGRTTKAAAAAGVVVTVAVASGVVLFDPADAALAPRRVEAGATVVARPGSLEVLEGEASAAGEASAPPAPAEAEVARLREEAARLTAERDALVAERAALRAELGRVRERLGSAADPSAEAAPAEGAAVAFGRWGDVEVLRGIDWERTARAALGTQRLLAEYMSLESPEQAPRSLQLELAKHSNELAGVALEINGAVPTHVPGNGEYTHPFVMANLAAAHLREAGDPLSEAQRQELRRLGEEYDLAWERLQMGYDASTLALRKALDEVRLKRTFTDAMRQVLSAPQAEALSPAEQRDRHQLDLYSPMLVLTSMPASPVGGRSRDELLAALAQQVAAVWPFDAEGYQLAAPVLEAWVDEVLPTLTPVGAEAFTTFSLDDALRAGQAQLRAMEELDRLIDEPSLEERLRAGTLLFVPRLLAADVGEQGR